MNVDDIAQGPGTDTGTSIAQGMRKDIVTGAAQMSAVVIAIEIAQENAIVDTDYEIDTAMSDQDIASDPDAESEITSDERIETFLILSQKANPTLIQNL
jgi:hypothetical protein